MTFWSACAVLHGVTISTCLTLIANNGEDCEKQHDVDNLHFGVLILKMKNNSLMLYQCLSYFKCTLTSV